ncbi:hypothetical protein DWW96_11410 [Eubacterium sp. AF17-7]|uniref:radical SAM/SPASM domain-containing protein n=1 Tax=Eubacterium sp. AF17-7 TaxID=2293105 RepID=UPI000E4911E2|nr:SPASM domain-containing protein [Eubacterium sp. AF17-7]RGG63193.1 hypothetical protein DWW96_11410 [Eubacterium sp. AF17-7]
MKELAMIKEIAFEIGDDCNLKSQHKKCPINVRCYNKSYGKLTVDRIIKLMDEANKMGFEGYFAFHYYNEPLLYKDKLEEIINARPQNKYLLWTNGTLLNFNIENNKILNKFNQIVITCYDTKRLEFYKKIKNYYKNVQIALWSLDDRINIYELPEENRTPCERVLVEIPIDYYGNVHLCCEDWNNEYVIGNIIKDSLRDIVKSKAYKLSRNMIENGQLKEECPDICKKCYKKEIKENFNIENLNGCI